MIRPESLCIMHEAPRSLRPWPAGAGAVSCRSRYRHPDRAAACPARSAHGPVHRERPRGRRQPRARAVGQRIPRYGPSLRSQQPLPPATHGPAPPEPRLRRHPGGLSAAPASRPGGRPPTPDRPECAACTWTCRRPGPRLDQQEPAGSGWLPTRQAGASAHAQAERQQRLRPGRQAQTPPRSAGVPGPGAPRTVGTGCARCRASSRQHDATPPARLGAAPML